MGCHMGEIKVLGELRKQIGAQKETVPSYFQG